MSYIHSIRSGIACLNATKTRFPITSLLRLSSTKTAINTDEELTHFGFQTVTASEKDQKVFKLFEDVAESYDRMNDAMSLGIHRCWKDIFMERLSPPHGTKLLDMAGGTGDIAFRYIKYLRNLQKVPGIDRPSHVTVADINENMLEVGRRKAENLGYQKIAADGEIIMDFVCTDAEKLSFEDNTFSAYTIAFGIRNCTHIDKVLAEAYRVLQPGGRFMCLEFSQLNNEYLQKLYDFYSFQIIPPMGQILTGNWDPYQYLVESIRKFPRKDDFKQMIEAQGFRCVSYEDLNFGIVSIHSGFKL